MNENRDSSSHSDPAEKTKDEISEAERHLKRRRKIRVTNRYVFVLSSGALLFSVFLLLFPEDFTSLFYSSWDKSGKAQWVADNFYIARLFGMILVVLSFSGLAFLYAVGFYMSPFKLRPKANAQTTEESIDDEALLSIVDALRSLNRSIEKGAAENVLSEKERDNIIENLSNIIDRQLNATLLKQIEEKYGTQIRNDRLAAEASSQNASTNRRLTAAGDELLRKAAVYLIYGITAAVFGLLVFGFLIYTVSIPDGTGIVGESFYYSSRIVLVLLIEAFAFFFFNLYKTTLGEIKFIINEVTNAETKSIALVSAIRLGDENVLGEILCEFAKSERNFVLKKGERSAFHDSNGDQSGTWQNIQKALEKMSWGPGKSQ